MAKWIDHHICFFLCNAMPSSYSQPQYRQRYTEINNPKKSSSSSSSSSTSSSFHQPPSLPSIFNGSSKTSWGIVSVCTCFLFMFYILVMKITRNYMEGLCLCHPGMLENFRNSKSIVHIAVEHLANQIDTFFRERKKWNAKRVVKDLINIVEWILFVHNCV